MRNIGLVTRQVGTLLLSTKPIYRYINIALRNSKRFTASFSSRRLTHKKKSRARLISDRREHVFSFQTVRNGAVCKFNADRRRRTEANIIHERSDRVHASEQPRATRQSTDLDRKEGTDAVKLAVQAKMPSISKLLGCVLPLAISFNARIRHQSINSSSV